MVLLGVGTIQQSYCYKAKEINIRLLSGEIINKDISDSENSVVSKYQAV